MRNPVICTCSVWSILLLAGIAPSSRGQRFVPTVDLGGSVVQYGDSLSSSAATLSPAVRMDGDRVTLGVAGIFSQSATGWSSQGSLQSSLFTPAAGMVLGELNGSAGGSVQGEGIRGAQALAVARAHLMTAQRGGWAGLGAGTTWDGVVSRPVRLAEVAAWSYVGTTMALGSVTPTAVADTIRYTDAELAVRFDLPRVEIGVMAGMRAGDRISAMGETARAWGSASVTGWLSSRAALVASAGSYPVDVVQGFPGGRFVSLGLRFGPRTSHRDHTSAGAPAYAVLEALDATAARPAVITSESVLELRVGDERAGRRTIRVHAPRATTVEITGDFTAWEPVRLVPAGGGWWMVALPIATGAHEMNVRAGGGRWLVPPGLTTTQDEFGGVVGVLVVR